MKKLKGLFLSGLVLFSLNNANAVPYSAIVIPELTYRMYTALQIYSRLNQNLDRRMPSLKFVRSDQVNGYSNEQHILLTDSLLLTLTDENELAGIIAHEMAHSYSKDPESTAMEDAADRLSTYFLLRAGYDVCKTRMWVAHLQKVIGDYEGVDNDHPSFRIRFKALTMPWCVNGIKK